MATAATDWLLSDIHYVKLLLSEFFVQLHLALRHGDSRNFFEYFNTTNYLWDGVERELKQFTPVRENAMRAKDRAVATPAGPWRTLDEYGTPFNVESADERDVALAQQQVNSAQRPGPDTERKAIADFIAAARTDVVTLADDVLRLTSREMQEQIANVLEKKNNEHWGWTGKDASFKDLAAAVMQLLRGSV